MIGIYIVIILMVFIVLCLCMCASTPREPWEDEAQIKYVDEWIRNKTK